MGYPDIDPRVAGRLRTPKNASDMRPAPDIDMRAIRRLFEVADEVWAPSEGWYWSDVLKVYCFLGPRCSEGAGMQIPDWGGGKHFPLQRKRTRDRYVSGRGKSPGALPRNVPVEWEAAEALERLLAVPRADGHNWLLTNRPWRGTAYRLAYDKTSKWFDRTREAADVRLRFHDLRHVAASRWIAAGADKLTIMTVGGWESLDQVSKVYGHLWPKAVENLSDKLDALDEGDLSN